MLEWVESVPADAKTTACAVSHTASEALQMVAGSKELKSALFDNYLEKHQGLHAHAKQSTGT